MDNIIDQISYLSPKQIWVIVAILALLLALVALIVKERKGKKNRLLGLVTIILSAALLVMVLLGIRSYSIIGRGDPMDDWEETPQVETQELSVPEGDGFQDLSDMTEEELNEYIKRLNQD